MRVQSQLLEDLGWQALSVRRLSEERHKLGDRPKVGEEHPFPLSANRRPVIIHWKPRGQGGRRKTDHHWPLRTSWSTTSWWRVQSDPNTKWGAWERPLRHWTSPWRTRQKTDTRYCGGVCRRTELPTGLPTGVLRPSGRTELLEALSGWWRESSDEETKGPRRGVRLWGPATHIRSVW